MFFIILLVLLLCSTSIVFVTSLPQNNSSLNPYLTSTKLFNQNYQKMIQNFKIFMYEPNITQFNFGTKQESLFFSSLQNSSYLTQNPNKAHLFFLPFSNDTTTRSLARIISRIRNDFSYWNRTLGADHFYLSGAGINLINDRNIVELKKNAIQISCFPTRRHRFIPHKDITLPPIYDHHAPVKYGGGEFCTFDYKNDDVLYLGEALRFGCVPVVFTEGTVNDMPFMDVLTWKKIVVFVKNDVKVFETDTWRERHENMRRLGVVVSKHLRWNLPSLPFDAFNTVMYQLWLRRHTVRYESIIQSY